MIRIAALDDEKDYIEKICDITKTTMFHLNLKYEIKCYAEVESFLKDLQDEIYFDIYLLDIEMPEMNGIAIAREIRKKYWEPIIVYITNYMDYAVEAFEVNTYRYIPKQCIENKLVETYNILLAKKQRVQENVYVLRTRNSIERILYREIYYLKKEGKYVFLYHKRGKNRIRRTLDELLNELGSTEFLMIDRSYVVNLNHVSSLKQQQITLTDGSVLPVSKPRMQQVMNEIVKFYGV